MHPRILLDTHILIRWLAETQKLSREQLRVLDAATKRSETVAVSAITLLEIGILAGGRKLQLRKSLEEIFDEIESVPILQILPLTREIATEAGYLGSLRDPADRAIVATARVHGLKLMTSDQRIIESKLAPVIA